MKPNGLFSSRNLLLTLLLPCLFAFANKPEVKQKDTIKAIGCFANVRSDGEHANGYSARLWFQGSGIIGLIEYHHGLAGDPPMGSLTDIRFDPSTGKLSFKAKLTIGLHYCKEHNGVPSHDLLSFHGFLKADELEGNIVIEDQMDSPPVVVDTREKFLMHKDKDCLMENYENYDAWWQYWEPIFKFRGPKW
jgi:hypothetical protein